MNTIEEQVAVLQQKIDYLIETIESLAGESNAAAPALTGTTLHCFRSAVQAGSQPSVAAPPIGINRYRALQAKE